MSKTIATVTGTRKSRLQALLNSGAIHVSDKETILSFVEECRIINTEAGKILFTYIAKRFPRNK
jgi:hypothetical protein